MTSQRACGCLLPVTALPGPGPIGRFGPACDNALRFAQRAGFSVWQVLPLQITSATLGNSPYSALSSFALDPVLVDPDGLVADGWLEPGESRTPPEQAVADFAEARRLARRWLEKAYVAFLERGTPGEEFDRFRDEAGSWLFDFSLFRALAESLAEEDWTLWPAELRRREVGSLAAARRGLREAIEEQVFEQWVLDRQWSRVRESAKEQGVSLFGDLPLYVGAWSADVWSRQQLFDLDAAGRPSSVAGVPPDRFSETGQRWGHPTFRWEAHRAEGYRWWVDRLRWSNRLFDLVRIDHFRGLESFWSIPADAESADAGEWVKAPGEDVLSTWRKQVPAAQLVAEDLGVITVGVDALRRRFGLPGMRVLQFGFGEEFPHGPHIPEAFEEDTVAYTGTHDNDTTVGWWGCADPAERQRVAEYLGRVPTAKTVHLDLFEAALASKARLVIVPLQDCLGLGSEARINVPGQAEGNWVWRASSDHFTPVHAEDLARRIRAHRRGFDFGPL